MKTKQVTMKKYYVAVGDAANGGKTSTWRVYAKTVRGAIRAAVDKALYYEVLSKRSDAIVRYDMVERI